VRFWDTSALVPLLVTEPGTPIVRRVATDDPSFVVWWAARTECLSALARQRREGHLTSAAEAAARKILEALAVGWSEVLPGDAVRQRAERLLSVHPLRAADAFQLAAALVWSRGDTAARTVVSFDERLREAAQREGFGVLPERA
jgi:hypothetical protein